MEKSPMAVYQTLLGQYLKGHEKDINNFEYKELKQLQPSEKSSQTLVCILQLVYILQFDTSRKMCMYA